MPSNGQVEGSEGLVLKRFTWQEDGILCIVFSRDFGKLLLTDRLMKKKEIYGGKMDLFSHIEFAFLKDDSSEYQRLLTVESLDKHETIYRDTVALSCVSLLSEVVDRASYFFEGNQDIFVLLKSFLDFRDIQNSQDHELHHELRLVVYLIHLLRCLGQGLRMLPSWNAGTRRLLKDLYQQVPLVEALFDDMEVRAALKAMIDLYEELLEKNLKSKVAF